MLLTACEHSPVGDPVIDRWTGPWSTTTLTRLTRNGVIPLGLSEDGTRVLYRQPIRHHINGPNQASSYRDTLDVCLRMLPATGGSGVFEYCDEAPGQSDSLNNIVSAAVSQTGALLYVTATGPVDTNTPVREHWDLQLADVSSPGARHHLLALYRDSIGHPVVPAGTVNDLVNILWTGPTTFAAIGNYMRPSTASTPRREYVAVVRGMILPDSAIIAPLALDLTAPRLGPGPVGTFLVSDTDLLVRAVDRSDGHVLWHSAVPPEADRELVAVGCVGATCLALSRDGTDETTRYWRLDPAGGPATPLTSVPLPANALAWISPADGALIVADGISLYRMASPLTR